MEELLNELVRIGSYLSLIAKALNQIAVNTKPEVDEELQPKIKGFDTGFNPGGK